MQTAQLCTQMKSITKHPGFGLTVPCKNIGLLRSYPYDLDLNNRLLYYAGEIAILKGRTEITPEHHVHVSELYAACAIEEKPHASAFYAKLPIPRETDSEQRYRTKFWVRYFWLACFAADMDESKMLVEDPPNTYEGSYKSWFWHSKLKGSPIPCSDSPATQLMRIERELHKSRGLGVRFQK